MSRESDPKVNIKHECFWAGVVLVCLFVGVFVI